MGTKGNLDTKIDTVALNEVIVFANQYRQEVTDASNEIRSICQNMENEESLQGGDGDVIRENFKAIAQGCNNLDRSTEKIVKVLNDKLSVAINMRHGSTIGDSSDKVTAATKQVGVLKE